MKSIAHSVLSSFASRATRFPLVSFCSSRAARRFVEVASACLLLTGMANAAAPVVGLGGALAVEKTRGEGVQVANSSSLAFGTGSFTIEAWFKRGSSASGFYTIVGKQAGGGGTGFYLRFNTAKFSFAAGSSSNANWVDGALSITDTAWHHVAAVVDASAKIMSVYVDGVLDNSASFTTARDVTSTAALGIGWKPGYGEHFDGSLDDVRIWNTARTLSQIREYMRTPLAGNETGLVGYWNFEEGTGTSAADRSGNNNTGTLQSPGGNAEWITGNIGYSVSLAQGAATPLRLGGSDADDQASATAVITALPTNGTLYQTNDGSTAGTAISSTGTTLTDTGGNPRRVIYVPTASYFGADSFTYKVNDGTGDSANTLTVNLTIADTTAPVVTAANLAISGASGPGGAFRVGDTVTVTWNNSGTGDNNADIASVTVDFSQFGGATAVAASNSSGTWTATYTIVAGSISATNRNISLTATDNAGNTTTTAGTNNATVNNVAPTVTDARISISGASGTGGAFKIGDTVTATWNNTAGGDNNSQTVSGVTINFSQFGGGAAVAASNSSGTWTATHTIVAGAIDATNRNVSVTATSSGGNATTTADTTNATIDTIAPTVTDANISISGASGSGGTFKIGDTVTATWNNTAAGDNNSDTISAVTVNFSEFGGGAAVAASNSSGTWTATYTIAGGSTNATNLNVSVTATDNAGNATTAADTTNATFTAPPAISNAMLAASGTYGSTFATYTITANNTPITFSAAGLPTGLSVNTSTGQITGTPTQTGTFSVTLGATNAGGTGTATLALSIAKAPLTVTADAKSRTYGAANPTLAATITGFVNSETLATSGVTGAAALSTDATATTGVGTHAITVAAGTLAATNYTFSTFTAGTLTITKAPLTVTADAKSRSYGTANPTLTATITGFVNSETLATSGVTGAAAVSTDATAATGVGAHAIRVAAGTLAATNYAFTTFTAGSLTIGKATLTVTADDKSRGYGSPNPTFTAAVSGFVNGDTLDSATTGAPVLSTPATTTSAQGTYAITVAAGTLAAANYSFSLVNGTLTVTKAVLTATADAKTRVYGSANPSFTYTLTGFLNGDTAAVVTGAPELSTTATTATVAGTYTITAAVGTLAASNYTFAAANGTLTVTKAALTVTADAKTKVYGATNPTLTATITGWINDDTAATAVTGAAALSTDATATSGVGTYAITAAAGDLAASNYTFTFAAGTLSVTKAPLTVTADDRSRIYGATNPTLTATITGFVNGDTTATAVTGAAAVTTTATTASGVNTHAITSAVGTLAATNYAFTTFTAGTLTITKAPLTITADNKSKIYGATNPTLTATISGFVNSETLANSGVTGSAALSTTATASSGVNTYTITAGAGTLAAANYAFTSFVDGTLSVTKAVLTVTADDKSRGYGSANPEFTATVSGFVNGDTLDTATTGAPVLTTSATVTSAQGTYAINVAAGTLAAANYSFSLVNGTLTVTKAVLTATADAKTRVYGSANPSFTHTLTGFLNDDTVAVVTGTPELATSATPTSAAGTYAITAAVGTLAADNYTFAAADGTLTVTKASLTVTADAKSKVYSEANPTLTATITGFLNDDTVVTAITGAAALSTDATAASGVGSYAITAAAGDLAASNYTFTFAAGTLSVTKAPLTVTADDKARVYGTANPVLTATITGFVNGDTLASAVSGTATLTTSATTASAAGTHPIVAEAGTLAAPNYTFTFVPGTLTIAKAVLQVTADSKSRAYGQPNPAFTATLSGFVNGDTAANAVTGGPAFATTASSTSSVGSYPIMPSAGSLAAANYSFSFGNGTLTIAPATATLALANLNQPYTGQPRTVSVTTTPAGLAHAISYPGGSAPTNAGSYALTATISDPNYNGSAPGTLVIEKAAQTLNFALPSSVTIGGSVTLSATASSGLPVTFAVVSGNATLSGATLLATAPGNITVRATQAGNENYLAATTEQSLTVIGKLAQTIAFTAPADRESDAPPFALTATASSGLPVSFSVSSGPAMISGNTLTLTGAAGRVTIMASQPGDAAYSAAPHVTASFTATAAGPRVFIGDVLDRTGRQKVGDIAAVLPPTSNDGNILIVAPQVDVNIMVDFTLQPDGTFVKVITTNVTRTSRASTDAAADTKPPAESETRTLTLRGQLVGNVLSGRFDEIDYSFTTTVSPRPITPTPTPAGFYQSNSVNTASGVTYTAVSASGDVVVLAVTNDGVLGGRTTLNASGSFTYAAPGVTIHGTIDAPTTTITGTIVQDGKPETNFAGVATTTLRTDRLINLSSRARVGPAGNRTLITGFVIGGATAKHVLLRAIGPALADFGVTGALANPRLQLYDGTGRLLLENDDWSGDDTARAFAQLGAFALAPGARDAALLTTLAPGAYTMHVVDGGETGVALAEIYDASANPQTEYQRLINISSRGLVESGNGVLIGGFVVTGNAPKRVLVRGVGPALGAFGVSGTLVDPRLAIFSGSTIIAQNDNWGTPVTIGSAQIAATAPEIAEAARATGAFAYASGTRDAAVVVTLAPGAYTAQVTSADGGTGVALVEIYEVPE